MIKWHNRRFQDRQALYGQGAELLQRSR